MYAIDWMDELWFVVCGARHGLIPSRISCSATKANNIQIGNPGRAHGAPIEIQGEKGKGTTHLGRARQVRQAEGSANEMLSSSSGNGAPACRRDRNVPLGIFALRMKLQSGSRCRRLTRWDGLLGVGWME